jgi:hypothetical protein
LLVVAVAVVAVAIVAAIAAVAIVVVVAAVVIVAAIVVALLLVVGGEFQVLQPSLHVCKLGLHVWLSCACFCD